jgi:hypothetical protein
MKKIILSLILFLNLFCVFAETGIKNVYWQMPYDKLLMEKKVFEDKMVYAGDEIKILTEKNNDYVFYLFYKEKLFSIIIDTDSKKYIKEKKCIELIYNDRMYGSRYFENQMLPVEYITGIDISKYLFYMEESCDYIDDVSRFFDTIKEKNIKKSKVKIAIYQSTPETKAFVFENIIKDETFIVLLPD